MSTIIHFLKPFFNIASRMLDVSGLRDTFTMLGAAMVLAYGMAIYSHQSTMTLELPVPEVDAWIGYLLVWVSILVLISSFYNAVARPIINTIRSRLRREPQEEELPYHIYKV